MKIFKAITVFLIAFCYSVAITNAFAQQPKAVITIEGKGAVISKEGATYINSGTLGLSDGAGGTGLSCWHSSGTVLTGDSSMDLKWTATSPAIAWSTMNTEGVLTIHSNGDNRLSWVSPDGESDNQLTAIESSVATTFVNARGETMIIVYKPKAEDVAAQISLRPGEFTVDGVVYQYEWKDRHYVVTKVVR